MLRLMTMWPCRAAVFLALSATGCTGSGQGSLAPERLVTPEYVGLERGSDGSRSNLTVYAACNDRLRVSHVETPTEVRLSVFLREYDAPGEDVDACAVSQTVTLRAPLGDRPVIDEKSGEPVEVR